VELDTTVRVREGETVVISGLLRDYGGRDGSENEPGGAGHPAHADHCDQRAVRRQERNDRGQRVVGGRVIRQALSRAREEYTMYEDYYGFVEKPFSLTPDPKYLYKSETHANAFELLQYGIRRREGFVLVTWRHRHRQDDLCRALLDQLDRKTFTALVLNPFIAEDDLLRPDSPGFRRRVARGDEARTTGRHQQAGTARDVNDFLLSLLPLGATALLIIDEAQNLPRPVLEHIRILSNLETDKEKLLQIVLVGQLNLKDVLRSPELRQLDQRISIPLQPEAADRRGNGCLCGAPLDDRRRRLRLELRAESPAGRSPLHRRHSEAGEPPLRSRAARGLLRAGATCHHRDGAQGRGEPRILQRRDRRCCSGCVHRRRGCSEPGCIC
jgi:general secretion pathway protein A